MVRAYARYFADIRASMLRLATDDEVQGRIRDGYRKIRDMYAPAVFPPVTFLIGRFSTGGATSSNGMLVGLEFYAITASTPLDELAKFQRDQCPSARQPAGDRRARAHLYNQGNETTDRPGDLGYFIGYRIAEAFYERATDRRLALEAIIEVADSDVFLAQSGYEP